MAFLNKRGWLNRISIVLYSLTVICLIVSLIIAYRDINTTWSYPFVAGSVFLLLFSGLYFMVLSGVSLATSKWVDVLPKIRTFILTFIIFFSLDVLASYFTEKPPRIHLLHSFAIALGWAFGIAFLEVVIRPKSKE